jgi:hypothetical protein
VASLTVNHARPAKLKLGRLVATPGAIDALRRAGQDPLVFIQRHRTGDWGDVCEDDKALNDEAVTHEGDPERQARVLSSYRSAAGETIWVITEADRSSTCVLTPDEY